ncbi:MFS transporter [Luteimicrobium sp. DT211]|uniref:MFS transporter n=1 Tax=Luteimicrobium sp. DT211 TaxID=3393412 RepID=UPI003CEBB90F
METPPDPRPGRNCATEPAAAPSSWEGHTRGSRGYRRILVALFAAGVATFAQLYSLQGVLPLLASDLRVSAPRAALTVSAATLGLAAAVVPWSAVADRWGRVRAMSVSTVSATVLGLVVPLVPGLAPMLVVRFFEGAALAGLPAVAVAYLAEEVHRLHVPGAAGTYVAGTTIGGLLGRLVAGPVGEAVGWRWGVATVALLAAAATAVFLTLVPPARRFVPVPRGAGPGLGANLLANLRRPDMLVLFWQGFALMGGFVAVYNYLGFRLEAAPFDLPQTAISLLFLAYLAGTASSRASGRLVERLGRRTALVGSVVVELAGLALTLVAWLPVVLVGLVVFTAGFFGAHAVASGWTGQRTPQGRAQATSLYNLFYYAGSSVIGWLAGYAFASHGWGALGALVAGLAVSAAVLAALVLRPLPAAR